MLVETGAVTAYVIAWAVRKARGVAGHADDLVDASLKATVDKLVAAVKEKLGAHPALSDLDEEAATGDGQVSELTRQQMELALTAAARKDDGFARTVTELVARIRTAERDSGVTVVAGTGSSVFTGDAHAHVSGTGIAFGQVAGDVRLDRGATDGQPPDPPGPGRSRH